jgi:hypothetical protein
MPQPHGGFLSFRRSMLLAGISIAILVVACRPRFALWIVEGSTTEQLVFGFGHTRSWDKPVELDEFDVTECRTGGNTVWRVASHPALLVPLHSRPMWDWDTIIQREHSRIVYGQPPTGFASAGPARVLERGTCYLARAESYGTGLVAFRVDSAGRVIELPDRILDAILGASTHAVVLRDGSLREYTARQRDSAKAVWRAPQVADSLAEVRCGYQYRQARTWSDTLSVDAVVPYDTTTTGMLRYDTTATARGLTCGFVCTVIGPSAVGEAGKRSRCPARDSK